MGSGSAHSILIGDDPLKGCFPRGAVLNSQGFSCVLPPLVVGARVTLCQSMEFRNYRRIRQWQRTDSKLLHTE